MRMAGSGVSRGTIARGRRVVRFRGRRGSTSFEYAAAKERLALTRVPHAAVPTPGWRDRYRMARCGARHFWFISVWCNLGAHEVRAPGMWGYSVGIDGPINDFGAAVAAPIKQTENEGNKYGANSASDSANNCTIVVAAAAAAATTSRTRYR